MSKKLDNLAMDCIAAERAGMSYGKWKAGHPKTKERREGKPDSPKPPKICIYCGKDIPAQDRAKKYCSEYCYRAYTNACARAKYKTRKEAILCSDSPKETAPR